MQSGQTRLSLRFTQANLCCPSAASSQNCSMFRLHHVLFFTLFAFSAIAETGHFSEIGAAGEARTRDLRVKDPLLFWLSYDGVPGAGAFKTSGPNL